MTRRVRSIQSVQNISHLPRIPTNSDDQYRLVEEKKIATYNWESRDIPQESWISWSVFRKTIESESLDSDYVRFVSTWFESAITTELDFDLYDNFLPDGLYLS